MIDRDFALLECLKLAQAAEYDKHGIVMHGGTTEQVLARAKAYAEFLFGVTPEESPAEDA